MKTLLKRESLSPKWTGDLFDTERFLSPRLFDFNSDGFDFAKELPSVNIIEDEKEFKIEMAAPGLDREDFKVEVENGMLCISSEKEEEISEKEKNYARREYSYNSFNRSFALPDNSLPEDIDATYKNGILNIILPKKEVSQLNSVKEIEVH